MGGWGRGVDRVGETVESSWTEPVVAKTESVVSGTDAISSVDGTSVVGSVALSSLVTLFVVPRVVDKVLVDLVFVANGAAKTLKIFSHKNIWVNIVK